MIHAKESFSNLLGFHTKNGVKDFSAQTSVGEYGLEIPVEGKNGGILIHQRVKGKVGSRNTSDTEYVPMEKIEYMNIVW